MYVLYENSHRSLKKFACILVGSVNWKFCEQFVEIMPIIQFMNGWKCSLQRVICMARVNISACRVLKNVFNWKAAWRYKASIESNRHFYNFCMWCFHQFNIVARALAICPHCRKVWVFQVNFLFYVFTAVKLKLWIQTTLVSKYPRIMSSLGQ